MWRTKGMVTFGFGIVLIIIGVIVIITRPNDLIIRNILDGKLPLIDGTFNFEIWKHVDVEFKAYVFHVANPMEVERYGEEAILVEYGPYVYDERLEKTVVDIDESADTIEYTAKRTLVFNPTKSGNFSENDEITVLNSAYLGTILTIAGKFTPFLSTMGDFIPLLFPDNKSIFVRGKVKDILFDGLPLTCDEEAHPDLAMICTVLKSSHRPPIVRDTSVEGVYAYSLFYKFNGTDDGPFTISRGVKDRYKAGYISRFKKSTHAEYWSEENCSLVQGTDSIFYPPMNSRQPELFTFSSEMCRSIHIDYSKDEFYNGLRGYHYKTSKSLWNGSDSACYCPRTDEDEMACPLQGLLDLEECQKAPILMSEPHFLHGGKSLFSLAKGMHPDEDKHAAYVVVEPLTGAPLSGSRKLQLNLMLKPLPVQLLTNVSEGVFPLAWVEEGLTPTSKILEPVIMIHRVNGLLGFLFSMPLILGVLLVMCSCWMNRTTKTG